MLTLIAGLGFAALLVAEWRRPLRSLRIAAAVLALALYWGAQECLYCALRNAISTPAVARDTTWTPRGRRLSEYETGVKTMYREALSNIRFHRGPRYVALAVLTWLAISPALRGSGRTRVTQAESAGDASTRSSILAAAESTAAPRPPAV
jgi:hypothetical protein